MLQRQQFVVLWSATLAGFLWTSSIEAFDPPAGGWDYAYEAAPGEDVDGAGFTSLDGSFDHANGSDEWDGSAIGAGRPGGAVILEDSYLRFQDTGDPRDYGMGDPGSNRKLYFVHDLGPDGAAADSLDTGVTLNFRVRVPTDGPIDDVHVDGGGGIEAYPAGGDGYPLHNGAKGNIGIKQSAGGLVSLSLDPGSGLLVNGASIDTVDSAPHSIDLDPTAWQDVWVVISAGGTSTHVVEVWLNDGAAATIFDVASGGGSDYDGITYLALGAGATGESGALDVDYVRFKNGVHRPAGECTPPQIVTSSTTSGEGCDVGGTEHTVTLNVTGVTELIEVLAELPECAVLTDAGVGGVVGEGNVTYSLEADGEVSFSVDISGCCSAEGAGDSISIGVMAGTAECSAQATAALSCCRLIEPICEPEPEDPMALLANAFVFGQRELSGNPDCVTRSDDAYFWYHHDNGTRANNAIDFLYGAERGHGFVEIDPGNAGRNGWAAIGPFDDSPNARNRFGDSCPEEIYDSFIGFKDHPTPCSETASGSLAPCLDGDPITLADGMPGTYSASGGILRVDVEPGLYRFAGIVGESDNPHSSRLLVQDGESATPGVFAEGDNWVTLVDNHDQNQWDIGEAKPDCLGCGVFARVGFNCRIPPLGDGTAPDPVFVNMDENGLPTDPGADGIFGTRDDAPASSPMIACETGVLSFHLLQGNATLGVGSRSSGTSVDVNGPDLIELEVWRVGDVDAPGLGPFVRGDANDSGAVDLSDAQTLFSWLFTGGPQPPCLAAANSNLEPALTVTSGVYLLNFLFLGGPMPPQPFPVCGSSDHPNDIGLGCESFDSCP